MLDISRLIGLADAEHKLDIMAKDAVTSKVVVRVNIVEEGNKFYALLSGGLMKPNDIVGVDITDDMKDFNEVVRPLGYEWDPIQSGLHPYQNPLEVLRCEQKFASEGGDRRRLLLSKI